MQSSKKPSNGYVDFSAADHAGRRPVYQRTAITRDNEKGHPK
jgi:hypothetical protein